MIRLEEDLVARRVRHSREIVRRTARALKREGLTLASLRFRSGDEFTGQEGKHEVVKGSLRPRDAVGSGEDEDDGDSKVKGLNANASDEDTDVDTSEGELDVDGRHLDDNDEDDSDPEGEAVSSAMTSNSWLVRYERIREEIERRTALVDPLQFVRAYVRHMVILVAHVRHLPVMQMFNYPSPHIPNTWNRVRALRVIVLIWLAAIALR